MSRGNHAIVRCPLTWTPVFIFKVPSGVKVVDETKT